MSFCRVPRGGCSRVRTMTEKFVMAGDVAVHVADSEQGERVFVLLHGYLESMLVWEELASRLYREARVVTLDLPGHGISMVRGETHSMEWLAQVVRDLLDTLSIARCTLVGHSMGGYVALAFAAAYPERVDRLVLLSSTPEADAPEKIADRDREIALVQAGKKELLARVAPAEGFAPENRKRCADQIEDLAEQVVLTEDEGITALLRGMSSRRANNDLNVPELFIFGRHDSYIPPELASEVAAKNPRAQIAWLDHSGHMGLVEEPDEVAKLLLGTAQGVPEHV